MFDKPSQLEPLLTTGALLADRYQIVRMIGKGGMGRIYLAEDQNLGRMVAIKILHDLFAHEDLYVERFRREARAAAAIGHPNIVQVFDIGRTAEGYHYLAMEALEGRDLRAELKDKGRLELEPSIDIVGQILLALSAAHRAGVVHRDLKPSNIFLAHRPATSLRDVESEDRQVNVKLLDFGVSRFHGRSSDGRDLTDTGMLLGTASYMAPEQMRSAEKVDGRADLYSLGVILFECLTGTSPFGGLGAQAIMNRALGQHIPDVHDLVPDLPEALSEFLHLAMSEDPDDRFQVADDMIREVRTFRDITVVDGWGGPPGASGPTELEGNLPGEPLLPATTADDTVASAPTKRMEAETEPDATTELEGTDVIMEGSLVDTAPDRIDAQAMPSALGTDQSGSNQDAQPVQVAPREAPRGSSLPRYRAALAVVATVAALGLASAIGGLWGTSPDQDQAGWSPPEVGHAPEPGAPGTGTMDTEPQVTDDLEPDPSRAVLVDSHGSLPVANDGGARRGDADEPDEVDGSTAVAQAMARARDCLGRGDRRCCIAALKGLPRTPQVLSTLARCRRRPGKITRQSGSSRSVGPPPQATSQTGSPPESSSPSPPRQEPHGSELSVARDMPW